MQKFSLQLWAAETIVSAKGEYSLVFHKSGIKMCLIILGIGFFSNIFYRRTPFSNISYNDYRHLRNIIN